MTMTTRIMVIVFLGVVLPIVWCIGFRIGLALFPSHG